MAKSIEDRRYERRGRFYGDFRDYSDVGGKREALIPPGAKRATDDRETADALIADRIDELQELRRERVRNRGFEPRGLQSFAAEHLKKKKQAGRVGDRWLEQSERHLRRACEFFGANTYLHRIGKREVEEWVRSMQETPNGRGGTLSGSTIHHHLSTLSNLFRRASSDHVAPGYNPVGELMDRPSARAATEAEWLEVPDAALVLEAARLYRPNPDKAYLALHCVHPLVATFLLTGGRRSEVFGLDVEDVSFDRRVIHFRPNDWRGLKTRTSHRTVPLWPQLEEILRAYVFGGSAPASGLLFPSPVGDGMLTDVRKILDRLAETTGLERLRTKMFRHTYCTARLATYDVVKTGEGADGEPVLQPIPVSRDRVAREMGHGGTRLVERIYGHYGHMPHRSENVEFRVDQHSHDLGERLAVVRAGAGS